MTMKKILAFCLLLLIGSFVHGGSSPPQPILPEISPGLYPCQSADCFALALPVVTPYAINLAVVHSEVFPDPAILGIFILSPTSQEKQILHSTNDVNIQTVFVQNPLKSDIGTNKIKPSNGGNLTYSTPPVLYNCHLPST